MVIGRISFCGHPELHGTLCTSCGRNVHTTATAAPHADRGKNGRLGGGGDESSGRGEGQNEEGGYAMSTMSKVTMKGGGTLTVSSTGNNKKTKPQMVFWWKLEEREFFFSFQVKVDQG